MKTRKKVTATIAASLALTIGIGIGAANAATPTQNPTTTFAQSLLTETNLKASDWENIAKRATEAGDSESSYIASYYAAKARGETVYKDRGIASWVKKAAIAVLKYSVHKLPKWVRPYAGKIVAVLESVENTAEYAIAAGLMKQGIDGITATQLAHYIVLFLSTFGPI